MIIDRLHYITQAGPNGESHLEMMQRACESGVNWVQLRIKDLEKEKLINTAKKAREIANQNGAKLIINDHVDIALITGADGIHVGLNDMPVKDARKIVGDDLIIGGTANDLEAILRHVDEGADYIGLGPFRFTTSKQNLSPVLGKEGYYRINDELIKRNITIPVIAIGGITINDLDEIGTTGIHGVAVASLINSSQNPDVVIRDIYKEIGKWKN